MAKGNYDPEFLDKKRQLRLNRELLESFYPDYLKHKDYQQFRIWFMSNGTHITSKEIELIKRIRIDPFWISLDGPEEVHNKNRKYYSNKGSHSVVVQNIKTLQENGINVKVSCVMTGDYPYPEKLYTYLKSLKVSAIQICPVRNGCSSSFTTDSLEMVKQGYKNLFELIYEEIQKNDYSAFTLLKEDLSMGAISTLLCRVRQSERCTWGHEVVLDEKGNMYPCLYVIGEEEFSLGNIDEKKNSKEILKPINVNQLDKCSECWARYLCGGTCHYNSIVNNKTIFETDDFECQIRKCVIEEAINFLINLIANKIDFRKVISALNK